MAARPDLFPKLEREGKSREGLAGAGGNVDGKDSAFRIGALRLCADAPVDFVPDAVEKMAGRLFPEGLFNIPVHQIRGRFGALGRVRQADGVHFVGAQEGGIDELKKQVHAQVRRLAVLAPSFFFILQQSLFRQVVEGVLELADSKADQGASGQDRIAYFLVHGPHLPLEHVDLRFDRQDFVLQVSRISVMALDRPEGQHRQVLEKTVLLGLHFGSHDVRDRLEREHGGQQAVPGFRDRLQAGLFLFVFRPDIILEKRRPLGDVMGKSRCVQGLLKKGRVGEVLRERDGFAGGRADGRDVQKVVGQRLPRTGHQFRGRECCVHLQSCNSFRFRPERAWRLFRTPRTRSA